MKRNAWIGICVTVLAVGIAGCSWETGDDATTWSSTYNWVNFSGVYRGGDGAYVVSDFSTTPLTPGTTNEIPVSGEDTGKNWVSDVVAYSGTLKKDTIKLGTVTITLEGAGKSYSDIGTPGVLGDKGTISAAGAWSLNLGVDRPTTGSGNILASYTWYSSNEPGGGGESGATRVEIRSFNITHNGQNLTIIDNTGAQYTGYIKQMRSTSGLERDNETGQFMPQDGDSIIASFECSGVSTAMMQVKIVGSLEGTVSGGVFTGRTLNGTWVELGGKTGDIYATTGSIVIPPAATPVVDPAATATP